MIHSTDITFQMLEDWRNVDLNSITKQTLYTMEDSREEHRKLIIQCKNVKPLAMRVAAAQGPTANTEHAN